MASLPDYLILDPKVDRLPPRQLRELQSQRLREMVRYCYDAAPFWRRKFDAAGIRPEDIRTLDDLPRIPFCTKSELQADQAVHPPFGSYIASSRSQWRKFATTSGTTGAPLKRVFSARDWGYVMDRFRRNPSVAPGDAAVILGPVDGLMGPMGSAESLAGMGAMVVLAGLYDTKTKIRLIQELRPALVSGTASYLLHVAAAAREMGVDLPSLGIRSIASVGEPGAAVPETRRRMLEGWGAQHVSDGYGLTELFPLGGSCPFNPAIHIASDLAYTEIVDPETGAPLSAGEVGEIVYTNLVGDTQPLLRYRTRDLGRLSTAEACNCGHTGARLEGSILGRVDDMIWYRGANIFPSAIEAAVRRVPDLGPEYQIEISGDQDLPTLTVRAEASIRDLAEDAVNRLRTRLEASLRESVRINAHVEIVAPSALPRPDGRGKVRRVVDHRVRSSSGGTDAMLNRREFIAFSAAGIACSAAGIRQSEAATIDKPARIMVGFPPGGATDIPARLIAEQLADRYAPTVLVENKPGAAGRIAVEQVKNAPPDGSTMLMTPGSHMVIFPHVYRKLSYDPERDFIPVAMGFYVEFALVVGPKVPPGVANARDFVRWCQANPKDAAYGSPAAGTVPHFAGVMLARTAGIEMLHVPYKGGAPAMQDVMGGQIACYLATMGEALPHIRAGRLRVLATSGPRRSSLLPDIPTLKESGYDVEAQGWFGFFLPAKTSPATVTGLSAAVGDALKTKRVANELANLGYEIASTTPASFAARVRADYERWGPIVKASGFTAEE